MPALREYHILISHSWDYSEHYKTVKQWLSNTGYFKWKDYSVPFESQLPVNSARELRERIRARISLCSCVIILSGMYVAYSDWIDFEIETAVEMGKPIIGVKPWGQERIPSKVQNNANAMVGWNSDSIVEAVRNYAL